MIRRRAILGFVLLSTLSLGCSFAPAFATNAYLNYGVQLYNKNYYEKARPYLEAAVRQDPYDPMSRYYLALCYQDMKQGVLARTQFKWLADFSSDPKLKEYAKTALSKLFLNPKVAGSAELIRETTPAFSGYSQEQYAAAVAAQAKKSADPNASPEPKKLMSDAEIIARAEARNAANAKKASADDSSNASAQAPSGEAATDAAVSPETKPAEKKETPMQIAFGDKSAASDKIKFKILFFASQNNAVCTEFYSRFMDAAEKYKGKLGFAIVNFDDEKQKPLVEKYKIKQVPRLVYLDQDGNDIFNEDLSRFRERLKDLSGGVR